MQDLDHFCHYFSHALQKSQTPPNTLLWVGNLLKYGRGYYRAEPTRPSHKPCSKWVAMDKKFSQFVSEVVNFSSQYGTQGSRSYTACNLEGGLNIYDGYGDRTEAFVLVS